MVQRLSLLCHGPRTPNNMIHDTIEKCQEFPAVLTNDHRCSTPRLTAGQRLEDTEEYLKARKSAAAQPNISLLLG